jgi:L-threonylcarbamoyladenylate synthase
MTRVVPVDARAPTSAALADAVAALRAGRLVAFPTETFYGLGAAALTPAAIRNIFRVKGRPESKPLLVLVDSIAMAERIAAEIPERARALMARHWPGALTLVLTARAHVPIEVTAGSGTVGVRLSAHPVAQALVRALGQPITAPSANPTGLTPPTTVAGVLAYFPSGIEVALDAGATPGGAPSTVLDVTVDPPRVVRAGAVQVAWCA